jgi:tripeptide aminopeptidase
MKNSDVVETFLKLVRIDSPSGSESAIATYLQSELQKLDIESVLDPAGNLFAKINGPGDPVVINAHMDTVEPGRGVKPKIDSGIITSDGTTVLGADNKVAVAAIMSALAVVDPKHRRSLELVFSVREETESGISEFDFTKLKSKSGLVADRASEIGSIVLASPWIMNLKIKIIGTPCHAGVPEQGQNALTAAAAAISTTTWGRVDSKTTSNLGLISGGSAMNAVPGIVDMVGEIRSFSQPNLENYLFEIKTKFENICQMSKVNCQIKSKWYCPGYEHDSKDPAIEEVVKIMKKLQIDPFFENAFGASDANTFATKGIKVVCIGDGCKNPHTKEESISVANLELLKNLFTHYIINSHE